MRQLIFVIFIMLLCSNLNSCKNKYAATNQNSQIDYFFKKNGYDFISEKDLISIVKLAQNKIKEQIVEILIRVQVPPIPPKKSQIVIVFPNIQKERTEVRRFIAYKHLNNKLSAYIGRKLYPDGKWYSNYDDGENLVEGDGFEWEEYSVSEYEYYKIKLDNDVIVYHRVYKDLSFERVRSILLFLKENKFNIISSDISINKKGFQINIPSEKEPYHGLWVNIIENGDTYKIIETGKYAN